MPHKAKPFKLRGHIHRFEYDACRFLWWCIDCNGCLVEGDMQKFMDKHRDKAATDNFSGSMDKMIDMETGYLKDELAT